MNVYEFEKNLLTRLEESYNVLQCKGSPVPASEVREEWACHVELKIEPAGWQALWKINRATCEQLNIKYPTVVFGTVNNVYFQDLMADFSISAVQDDDIHLPELHEVPLEDLWPTIDQENPELNTERTADCIDELRFFYRNVWMPWDSDNDDDSDWCKKHLESRIRFCFDLKKHMSRAMADHIRKLLAEARYIQNKREIVELEISDDEELDEDPQKVKGLTRMQLRMIEIRNEIKMLENPTLRKIYEEMHFKGQSENNNVSSKKPNVFIVTKKDTVVKQLEFFHAATKMLGKDEMVEFVPSFQDCLKVCAMRDHIYLPSGWHTLKLLEPLNSGGILKSIVKKGFYNTDINDHVLDSKEMSIIASEESDTVLLLFNGNYTIENIIFDCRHVRLGIWCKNGTVTLKNCHFVGERSSSVGNGIVIANGATCTLENTILQNFATGVSCAAGSTLVMNQSTIFNCGTGLDIDDASETQIKSSKVLNNNDFGMIFKTNGENVIKVGERRAIVSNFDELRMLIPTIATNSDCTFTDNKKGNIAVIDKKNMISLQHSEYLEDNYDESGFSHEKAKSQSEVRMDVSV